VASPSRARAARRAPRAPPSPSLRPPLAPPSSRAAPSGRCARADRPLSPAAAAHARRSLLLLPSQVHKFGGTCVASAERIDDIARYLTSAAADGEAKAAVVSAMGATPASPTKVTDLLINMVAKAAARDGAFVDDLAALEEKHLVAAAGLLGAGAELDAFTARLLADMADLKAMLKAISIAAMSTEAFEEFVVGHGELWCGLLLTARLRQLGAPARFMDARDVLVVAPTADGGSVDVLYEASEARLDVWAGADAAGAPGIIVATGFIARNPAGQATTLKRNGSDYSATVLGALLRAGRITIWTDVDGVYSADPRKVPEAVCLRHLAYHEAWELSYFGANVLHPRTTQPAMRTGIPIRIRNFFNRAAPGTEISAAAAAPPAAGDGSDGASGVKGFATIDHVALIDVEGTGMVGVPGTAAAIFSTMRDAGINVIMISQASSEHSVCFAVRGVDADAAVAALSRRFRDAIDAGRISAVQAIKDCCVLAVVGQGMASNRGVAATAFSALAKANINIRCIAQGCSEYNITALIDQRDAVRALRAVHARFYLKALPIGVGLIGPGLIGATLLAQLHEQAEALRERYHIDVRVLGVASSTQMLLSEEPLPLGAWRDAWAAGAEPLDMDRFAAHLATSYVPNTVVVDCTASDGPPARYLDWMRAGVHVITPNKKLNSGPLARYAALKEHQRTSYIHYFYEATVGAGLPVVATLQHLLASGDRIERIEGIFSGTLSYIFNSYAPAAGGAAFSDVVLGAKAEGYTEPDPRDDLSGADVARKVTILARECGLELELADVPVHSLVPGALAEVSVEEYLARLPEFDAEMAALAAEAEAAGEVLRYVGVVDVSGGGGAVELRRYPKAHAFSSLTGSDNIIAFSTARYAAQPLVIRGPGAGAEVTAGGVFSDLLRLAAYLGAAS
jgi:aspartokinase/homoserine dehydrogenase 1